jgi:16S rRNA (uracil1498-N3)-methyltransferase
MLNFGITKHMSRLPRFFISPEQVAGSRISIYGEDVRHIAVVLRMKPGEKLLLCDGKGGEYTAQILRTSRSEIVTEIMSESHQQIPYPHVTLGQGLPKTDKMDWIMQKGTELGVEAIVPLVTERTILRLKDEEKRITRWQKICREAAMQSARVNIPRVSRTIFFRDFLSTLDPGPLTLLLLLWQEGVQPVKEVLRNNDDVKKIVVLIGPEGGFSAAEAEMAKARGFHPVSLGLNILRTETAAIAVLSMIMYEYN